MYNLKEVFMKDLIEYVDFICDLQAMYHIPKFELDESLPVLARYVAGKRLIDGKILVNPKILDDRMMMYYVLAHELRHACQFEAMNMSDGNALFDSQILEEMKKNTENYIPARQDGYYTQILELDAFGFSEWIMNTIFGIRTKFGAEVPLDAQATIYAYAKTIDYRQDEIQSALQYSGFTVRRVNDKIKAEQYIA